MQSVLQSPAKGLVIWLRSVKAEANLRPQGLDLKTSGLDRGIFLSVSLAQSSALNSEKNLWQDFQIAGYVDSSSALSSL